MTEATTPATRRDNRAGGSRTKAIIAIAAGAVLLLGGGTTLAYWSTTQAIDAGAVNSGDLDLTAGTATWTLVGSTGSVTVADLADVQMVPGDVLTITQPVSVTLEGQTILAELAVDPTGTPTLPEGYAVETSLTAVTTGDPAALTAADDGATFNAVVTVTFDSATAGRVSTAPASVDLTGVYNVTLEQIAN